MKLLFDTDLFIYQVCNTLTYNKDPKDYPPFEHFFHLLLLKQSSYRSLLEKWFDIKTVNHFITAKDRSNFRYRVEVDPPYKHNRANQELPHGFYECVEYCQRVWKAEMIAGMEADDAIGIACSEDPQNTIRVSEKDLRMIPGWHYDISVKFPSPIYVTDPGHLIWCRNKTGVGYVIGWGKKWFYFQMLVGDRADGVGGVPGIGEKKAFDLLYDVHTLEEMEDLVYNKYEKVNLEPLYDKNKQLLWICRSRKDIPNV